MRVCITRHAYFPDDPRDRKQAYALVEAGHSVDVVCLRRKGQAACERVRGVSVHRVPLTHKRMGVVRYVAEYVVSFVLMSVYLFLLSLRRRFDVIQVSTMPDVLVFATVVPRLLGARILLDLHEPTPELWVTKYGPGRLRFLLWLQTWVEQAAIRYAHACVTVSEALRCRFGERGADLDKITVIPNACEEETFHVDPDAPRRPRDGKFVLVTHGLIVERYGHALAIRAVHSLRERFPDLHYEIVGDGEGRSELERLVRELGCEERVNFAGFVSIDAMLEILRGADVGVVAMERSPYSELVDTNKMYEYIALGLPVIQSRLPAVEQSFDDTCTLFFEPGDWQDLARAIAELHDDSARARGLAENALKRYDAVRWNRTKLVYVGVAEQLVSH